MSDTSSNNEWQRVTTNDNEWKRMPMSGPSDKEWYNERQRVRDNEWLRMTSDNKWQQVITNVVILANFPFFFRIREKQTTMHPKETLFNIEENLEERLLKWG